MVRGGVFLCFQRSCRIDDTEYHHTDIAKDGQWHGQCTKHSRRGEQKDEYLHDDGEPRILKGYANGAAGDAHCRGYLRRLVVHKNDIGSLYGGITAKGSHGYSHIGTCQYGGVIDAVADKSKRTSFSLCSEKVLNTVYLVGRKEL